MFASSERVAEMCRLASPAAARTAFHAWPTTTGIPVGDARTHAQSSRRGCASGIANAGDASQMVR